MDRFAAELGRFHRGRVFGRTISAVVAVAALLVMLVLAFGLGDAAYAFAPGTREVLRGVAVAGAVVLLTAALVRAVRLSRRQTAREADELLEDPRGSVAGTEALPARENPPPITAYLAERARKQAADSLRAIPAGRRIPWRLVGRASALLAVGAIAVGAVWVWNREAVRVIGQRLLWPDRDIPPYSAFRFELGPAGARAIYGGELLLTADISGAGIEEDVYCLIRDPRTKEVQRLRAYRESDRRYARRIENVVAPLEAAFGVGKARSEWLPVEVLYQPRILATHVRIRPPMHTGLPADEFAVEENELQVLEGSEVELSVTSNRPLSGGLLKLAPADRRADSVPLEVKGEPREASTVTFKWKCAQSGALSVMIRDVRSTEAEAPLELNLRVNPDEAPLVELTAPDRLALATPRARLPLGGTVEDDFGLARVQLVRTLVGYRDRGRLLADSLATKKFDFEEQLDLEELGVEAGQILEFYLEASDRNPTLLGVGTSEVVRVAVISEDDYAERIRARTTLKEFVARYEAAAEAVRKAAEALEAMDRAADLGQAEALEAARKEAVAQHQEAAELLKKIAEDFPAFALEERLKAASQNAGGALAQNLQELQGLDLKKGEAAARLAIEEMRKRLGKPREEVEEVRMTAKQIEKIGEVMEMAAEFQKLYATQSSIANRFGIISKEISEGITRNRRQLEALATVQERNREGLEAFREELEKRAGALPDEFAPLRESVDAFLAAMDRIEIASPMDAAAKAGRDGRAVDASTNAELAKLQMEQLMSRSGEGFCQMCQGNGMPKFEVPLDVNQTMAQLLESLLKQGGGQGIGGAGGTGAGFGGTGQDGFAMAGSSLHIPAYGPDRLRFAPVPTGASGGGKEQPARPLAQVSESDTLEVPAERRADAAVVRAEEVPEIYREAVKRYFSRDLDGVPETLENPNPTIP